MYTANPASQNGGFVRELFRRQPAAQRPEMSVAQAQEMGRFGDTILAHINPDEARMLKNAGGSGTRNPRTGLLEFRGEGGAPGGAAGRGEGRGGGDGPGAGAGGGGGGGRGRGGAADPSAPSGTPGGPVGGEPGPGPAAPSPGTGGGIDLSRDPDISRTGVGVAAPSVDVARGLADPLSFGGYGAAGTTETGLLGIAPPSVAATPTSEEVADFLDIARGIPGFAGPLSFGTALSAVAETVGEALSAMGLAGTAPEQDAPSFGDVSGQDVPPPLPAGTPAQPAFIPPAPPRPEGLIPEGLDPFQERTFLGTGGVGAETTQFRSPQVQEFYQNYLLRQLLGGAQGPAPIEYQYLGETGVPAYQGMGIDALLPLLGYVPATPFIPPTFREGRHGGESSLEQRYRRSQPEYKGRFF